MGVYFKGYSKKLTWKQVRKDVKKVNPELARIIDFLSPSDDYWLLKAVYPYGGKVMQKSLLSLPNGKGDIVPITDETIDPEIREGLKYNLCSNPLSLVLKNSFEIYLPLKDRVLSLAGLLLPGGVFGASRMLDPENIEEPIFHWEMTSGARSIFMLPRITDEIKHTKLQKEFGITASVPRTLMQQFDVFRELANNERVNQEPWYGEILYFPECWFSSLGDTEWKDFYDYFYHSGRGITSSWRVQPIYYNLIFSLILSEYESRPNAYIMDIAQYLVNMGVGAVTGLGPALDTSSGPWDLIQSIYQDIYEIKNYPPVIIQPQFFNMRDPKSPPVYYSLQFPCATEFKPSTRKKVSIITDLHEIRSLMRRYERDFLADKYNLGGTSLYDLFRKVQYDYFHSASDLHEGMMETTAMASDKGLRTTVDGRVHEEFPTSCLFGRGCIRLTHK